MKQKISPGHILDFVSPEELSYAMDNQTDKLLQLLGKNARFVRSIATGESDNAGNFSIQMGPDNGFLWSVRWITWSGTTGTMNMYLNQVNNLGLIESGIAAGASATFLQKESVILKAPDLLIFNNKTAADLNAQIQVQLMVLEVPFSHESQLF